MGPCTMKVERGKKKEELVGSLRILRIENELLYWGSVHSQKLWKYETNHKVLLLL